jgi:hypothetical protein
MSLDDLSLDDLPLAERKDWRVVVLMLRREVREIDEWRRKQRDMPSRSEAVRRLVAAGLKDVTEAKEAA